MLAADGLGKIKTVLQDVAVALLLVSMPFILSADAMKTAGEIIAYLGLACFALCTVLTVVSGVNYLIKNKEVLKG